MSEWKIRGEELDGSFGAGAEGANVRIRLIVAGVESTVLVSCEHAQAICEALGAAVADAIRSAGRPAPKKGGRS